MFWVPWPVHYCSYYRSKRPLVVLDTLLNECWRLLASFWMWFLYNEFKAILKTYLTTWSRRPTGAVPFFSNLLARDSCCSWHRIGAFGARTPNHLVKIFAVIMISVSLSYFCARTDHLITQLFCRFGAPVPPTFDQVCIGMWQSGYDPDIRYHSHGRMDCEANRCCLSKVLDWYVWNGFCEILHCMVCHMQRFRGGFGSWERLPI